MKNWRVLLAMVVPLALAACTVTPTQPLESHLASAQRARYASAPPDRLGLGTKWGERRISLVGTVSFERANFNHPFAVAAIYYNDKAGIRAMAGTVAWERRVPVLAEPAAALVTIELRAQSGRMLPGLIVGDRWFVVGQEGRRYSTRNVGVIGIALFNEAGSDPWTNEEVRRRLKANPFPGRFATPP